MKNKLIKTLLVCLSVFFIASYTSVNALVLADVQGAQVGGTATGDPVETCQGFLGDPTNPNATAYWVQQVLNILRYVAIIVLIILSSIDFIKAIASGDADALKKATTTFGKRLIYCVLIFLTPTIVNFLLGFLGVYSTCGL